MNKFISELTAIFNDIVSYSLTVNNISIFLLNLFKITLFISVIWFTLKLISIAFTKKTQNLEALWVNLVEEVVFKIKNICKLFTRLYILILFMFILLSIWEDVVITEQFITQWVYTSISYISLELLYKSNLISLLWSKAFNFTKTAE